ncbi:MAG: cytochrome o ubiquinol oxidase subunit IV [Paracoccus sp. (in: a-proteobacteria)]|uniref:cytochrome o ubiquinol oxidase subunit IV n=1 Tax=Paracoccus sp. TaxID=267 RepID=UPI0039E64DE9
MAHEHHHGHDAHHHDHHDHGSVKSYVTGFVLAAILTIIPFWLVMAGGFESRGLTIAVVMICAVVQVLVHMIFFLHMTSSQEEGWTLISTVFTAVIVIIVLAGSLWVMFHMTTNMMPQMNHELQVLQ